MSAEAEWLDWRRGGVGASDVPAIAGLSPYASPMSVYLEKLGLLVTPESPLMRFGKDLEQVIARMFTRETGLYVLGAQTTCTHPDEPWARCTVDGFTSESPDEMLGLQGPFDPDAVAVLGVFESKYTSQATADELPLHYAAQAQWQMFVTGHDVAHVAVLSLAFGRPSFRVYEVARDESAIARLVGMARAFWFDHVLALVPPPIDASTATEQAIKTAYAEATPGNSVDLDSVQSKVRRLVGCRRNLAQLERDIRGLENEIRAALGTATEGLVTGQLVVSWRPQARHTIDAKRLRAELPEVASEYTNETTVRVFRVHANDDEVSHDDEQT